ncbi:transglycosylase domain-containing protein [Nonomuraea sp. SYSU D8015]|uniref:transglycosylase domain-containing protein n=1 Tax=Nonomuraea sp. SYSU D8015 TaxID=2593644 RepID=UPI001661589E|nr:transglycosylase domain-containing protein [Nonomuraea sp. SYSU D8015]
MEHGDRQAGPGRLQAAAQAFFDKDVDKLTPAEGAYLAGRIQSPDAFDKAEAEKNWAPTRERFAYAIDGMAIVDPAKYGQLPKTAKFPKLAKLDKKETLKGINGYMVDIVQRELERRGIAKERLRSGGFRVTTTFDKKLMRAAKKAVEGHSLRSYVSGNGPITLPGTKPIGNSHDVGAAVQIDRATAESVNTASTTTRTWSSRSRRSRG